MLLIINYFLLFFFVQCIGKGNVDSTSDEYTIPINTRINLFNSKKITKKKDNNILDLKNKESINKKNIKNLSPEKAISILEKIKKKNIKISPDNFNLLKQKYLDSIIYPDNTKLKAKNYIQKNPDKYKKEYIKKIQDKAAFINFLVNIKSNNDIKFYGYAPEDNEFFSKYLKDIFTFFGSEMNNNNYTKYHEVYSQKSNFEKNSLVALLESGSKSEGGYELLQKAIDLELISINDEYKSRGSKSIDAETKDHNSLLETILSRGLDDPVNINNTYINVLKKLVNNNDFLLKKEQIERINNKLFMVAWQIEYAYKNSMDSLKTFSKYLKNDSHSDELTDYKDVEITLDDIAKLQIFDNSDHEYNKLKSTLLNLYNKKGNILKNNINLLEIIFSFPKEYFKDKNNNELSMDEVFELKLKFIKYLLRHEVLDISNLSSTMLYKIIFFDRSYFLDIDKISYFSYKKKDNRSFM